jgi:NAD+ synthase (glutamine-hydrolysing)
MHGYYRIAAAVPRLHLANPARNVDPILSLFREAEERNCTAVVFPELCLTGYTAADLFFQERLYDAQNEALKKILAASENIDTVAVVGMALIDADRLYNCAAVIRRGAILGIVPKSYLPNKREYYEKRQFTSGRDITRETVRFLGREVPFGVDLLFDDGADLLMGVEICEDLWAVTPPSNHMASNGANLILNPSASNELIGKADYRAELVRTQSARCLCAYAYASSGTGESSTDAVFGGDCMVAEYGALLARGERFLREGQMITAEVDLRRLRGLRLSESAYGDARRKKVRKIPLEPLPEVKKLSRFVDPRPFVPSDPGQRDSRAREILAIQAHGLARRLEAARSERAVIGVSGGLDSTLALLVAVEAAAILKRPPSAVLAVTMPGFGTTGRTYDNAVKLCRSLDVELREIPIRELSESEFDAIGHDPELHDVTYENVQARARTQILMNLANKEHGLVVGTGDLSEIALGWSTYNGDHMSMYAVNASVPKTLIRYLIETYAAEHPKLSEVLEDILATPVSPELLPSDGETITQETEEIVGPYELHDFFLYHFLRYGAEPAKILWLATHAFEGRYDHETIRKWLRTFLRRFFTQQFKRSCMPDGPKVGTVSLSPRADWRMPSDAEMEAWTHSI